MSGFPYLPVMRSAPKILFALAVVIFLTSFLGEGLSLTLPNAFEPEVVTREKTGKLFAAVSYAFYSASFPLFGAAFLHRLDHFMERRG